MLNGTPYIIAIQLSKYIDVNECDLNNGGCDDNCINTVGGYYCECREGHTLINGTLCIGNMDYICSIIL